MRSASARLVPGLRMRAQNGGEMNVSIITCTRSEAFLRPRAVLAASLRGHVPLHDAGGAVLPRLESHYVVRGSNRLIFRPTQNSFPGP